MQQSDHWGLIDFAYTNPSAYFISSFFNLNPDFGFGVYFGNIDDFEQNQSNDNGGFTETRKNLQTLSALIAPLSFQVLSDVFIGTHLNYYFWKQTYQFRSTNGALNPGDFIVEKTKFQNSYFISYLPQNAPFGLQLHYFPRLQLNISNQRNIDVQNHTGGDTATPFQAIDLPEEYLLSGFYNFENLQLFSTIQYIKFNNQYVMGSLLHSSLTPLKYTSNPLRTSFGGSFVTYSESHWKHSVALAYAHTPAPWYTGEEESQYLLFSNLTYEDYSLQAHVDLAKSDLPFWLSLTVSSKKLF